MSGFTRRFAPMDPDRFAKRAVADMRRSYRIPTALAVLAALYLGAIVAANATSAKLFSVAGVHITAGAVAIPVVFVATDLLNELYGPRAARQVVWMGLLANLMLTVTALAAVAMPPAPVGVDQAAFERVFATTWRVAAASSIAYLSSSLLDVWVFERIRRATGGRMFWVRKNGSTAVSQAVDTAVFVVLAFAWVLPVWTLATIWLGQYLVKMALAPLLTPVSYLAIKLAKGDR